MNVGDVFIHITRPGVGGGFSKVAADKVKSFFRGFFVEGRIGGGGGGDPAEHMAGLTWSHSCIFTFPL